MLNVSQWKGGVVTEKVWLIIRANFDREASQFLKHGKRQLHLHPLIIKTEVEEERWSMTNRKKKLSKTEFYPEINFLSCFKFQTPNLDFIHKILCFCFNNNLIQSFPTSQF
jgi:hypothetical protein